MRVAMTNRFTRRRFVRVTGGAAAAASIGAPGWSRASAAEEATSAVRHVNVVVIGAGLSGLMAGRELHKLGVDSFVVLEARDRVGGRTLNMPIGGGHVVEVGGEWIGPGQRAIAALIDELGIGAFDHYYDGDTTYDIEGRISRGLLPDVSLREAADFGKVAWQLDRLAKKIPIGEPWRMQGAAALDQTTLGNWLAEHAATSFTPSVFRLISRAVWSGYPERISLLWVLHYLRSAGGLLPVILNDGGAQDQRIEGGSQVISQRMASELGDRVLLGRAVLRVEDRPSKRVRVVTSAETFTADRVIVAMAPSDTARIVFAPGSAPGAPRPGVGLGAFAAAAVGQSRHAVRSPLLAGRRPQRRDAERPQPHPARVRQLARRRIDGRAQLLSFGRRVSAPRRPKAA